MDYKTQKELLIREYDKQIWTIFYLGIGISFWILYKIWLGEISEEIFKIGVLSLGVMILFYSSLVIEKNSQRMLKLIYEIKKEDKNKKKLKYFKSRWLAEIIIFMVFIFYLIVILTKFDFLWAKISLELFVFILFFIVVLNWIRRPNFK